jgi:hypothetical protein
MKNAPRPVLMVRGAVATIASLATCARGRLRCSDQVSRMRSMVTTESFTDTPMMVSAAARNTPSIGLPSQAKIPTTSTTSCSMASTVPAAIVQRKRSAR